MNIVVSDIKMPIETDINKVFDKAIALSGINKKNVLECNIHKRSIDARKKDIKYIYSVKLTLKEKINFVETKIAKIFIQKTYNENYDKVLPKVRPIVIGTGPAGLFCAYLLAKNGQMPIVLERGSKVEDRVKDIDEFIKNRKLNAQSNIQFGEGGAGTFSDGKLMTRIKDERCAFVLSTFVKYGAPKEILYEAKPHIGTDKLRVVIKNMRNDILKLGGEIFFNTKVTDFIIKDDKIKGVKLETDEIIESDKVILAIGHSARDTYEKLFLSKVHMEKKAFSVGFRIEHLREDINEKMYGKEGARKLKSAEYQLSHRVFDRGCYSFCMCPGGVVIPATSEDGMVAVNGMSEYRRDGINSNSAIVASVLTEDLENTILSGVAFQRALEEKAFLMAGGDYSAPCQLAKDFLNDQKSKTFLSVKPSYALGTNFVDFNELFPKSILEMLKIGLKQFNAKINNFSMGDAVLTGVETRTSAPLRIVRNEKMMSLNVFGLYPCGEGAGYAGGITSAAVDGLKVAEAILNA